jgi:hypothetical protein
LVGISGRSVCHRSERRDPNSAVLAQKLGLVPPGILAVNARSNNTPTVFPNASCWAAIYKNFFGG